MSAGRKGAGVRWDGRRRKSCGTNDKDGDEADGGGSSSKGPGAVSLALLIFFLARVKGESSGNADWLTAMGDEREGNRRAARRLLCSGC